MTATDKPTPRPLDALLPCPFCGGGVKLEQPRHAEGDAWWGVVCRNAENLGGTCAIEQRPSRTKEAATERWNRRAGSYVTREVSEKFRAVNIAKVIEATGQDIFALAARDMASRALLAEAVDLAESIPGALSSAFMAGAEEREGGSARRQEKHMQPVDKLKADARELVTKIRSAS